MQSQLLKNKDEWLNQDFFTKLAQNPSLLKAFTDPRYSAIMSEFAKDPQGTLKKYGHVPEFKSVLEEFSKMMGSHFDEIADKKKAEQEAEERKKQELARADPVAAIIENDPQVKQLLQDPKVKKVLDYLRFKGGLDLHEVLRKDPETGMKLQYLISRGVLNANSQLP